MLGVLLTLLAVSSAENNFLTQTLFSSMTLSCEQFYAAKGVQVGVWA